MKLPAGARFATLVGILPVIILGSSLQAYNPPSGDRIDHVQLPADPTQYLDGAHGFIVQRALEILRNDGHPNWAAIAENHLQSIMDGTRFADTWLGRQGIYVVHKTLIFITVDRTLIRDWPLGGDQHYFNPDTGLGFDPGVLNELLVAEDPIGFMLQYGLTSLVGGGVINLLYRADIEAIPPLGNRYASGLDVLQRNWDIALAIAQSPTNDKSLSLAGLELPFHQRHRDRISQAVAHRGAYDTAFFHLGWALHLLHDLTVANHTYDSFFSNHSEYENASNNQGGKASLHASSGGIYESMLPSDGSLSAFCRPGQAKCFGAYAATQVHQDAHFDLVKDGRFEPALAFALPLAERLTAGMIAKFMSALGLPDDAAPILIHVRDENNNDVPGTYVFYKILEASDGTWNFRRTDASGNLQLRLPFGHQYIVRPTKPGYHFYGRDLLGEFINRSPDYVDTSQPNYTPFSIHRDYVLVKGTVSIDPGLIPDSNSIYQGAPPTRYPSLDTTFENTITQIASHTRDRLNPALVSYLEGEGLANQLATDLQRALITFSSDAYHLGVIGNGVGLPVESKISIQLNQLLQMTTGVPITGMPRLKQVFEDNYRFGAPDRIPESLLHLPGGNEQLLARLSDYLPINEIPTPDGSTLAQVPHLPWYESHLLEDHGLWVVPYLGDVELELGFVKEDGLIYSSQTIQARTNNRGLAQVILQTGSRAGLLRLRVQVKNNPSLLEFYQPKDLEFLVHPNLDGPEPLYIAPQLSSLQAPTVVLKIEDEGWGSSGTKNMDATDSHATREIERFEWYLSDGRVFDGPRQEFEFEQPGSYQVTLRVVDDAGSVNEEVRTIIIADDPLQAWKMRHFHHLEAEGIDDFQDPDRDGLGNFVEYALDLDPWRIEDSSRLMHLTQADDGGIVSHFYVNPERREVSYLLEQSQDLRRWRNIFDSREHGELIEQYLNEDRLMHLPIQPLNEPGPEMYFRFRVMNHVAPR